MQELFSNLGINGKLLIAQIVNFVIILFLLKKFVFSKLIQHLEDRRVRIEQGLELTEKAEKEMGRIEASRHREFEKAREEGEIVLAEARSSAASKQKEAFNIVRQEAEKILQKAKGEAEKEKTDAIKSSKDEINKIAVLMAEKVLSRSITKADQEHAVKEVTDYFEKEYKTS